MFTEAILAAAGNGGYGVFIAGLLIGAGIGLLVAPAVRSWLIYREWAEASRQARLTDKVLSRMEQDARRDSHRQRNREPRRQWQP
jgi:hypothetical protein